MSALIVYCSMTVIESVLLQYGDNRSVTSPRASSPPPLPSERVRLRRKRERGRYEREVIEAILDEALIAHLGITDDDGQPFVIPTLHARAGGVVYCTARSDPHDQGAAAGAPACLTVSLIDGLVLARSAMHHSANYRSVMLLGHARVRDRPRPEAGRPGGDRRTHRARAAGARCESRPTMSWRPPRSLSLPIQEASAKIRTGGPIDDEPDLELPVWAGVLPLPAPPAARSRTRSSTRRSRPPLSEPLPAPRRRVTA